MAKFRLKLKKVRNTTRPFRYDLNQIPYNYIVEMANRFKELDLIDKVPEELWTEVHNIVQEAVIKTIPKKKKCKKAKWLWKEALQIAVKRREVKGKGEKERYKHLNAEFQRIVRREKKAFLRDQCKDIEANNILGKTRDGVAEGWTRLSDFTFTFHFHALEEEMATHSSVLAWRIPGTAGPGGLLSLGSQSLTRLK